MPGSTVVVLCLASHSLSPTRSRQLTLRYGDRVLHEIRLLAPDGRLVQHIINPLPGQTTLQVNDLAAGMYVVQCIAGRQALALKVVFQKE